MVTNILQVQKLPGQNQLVDQQLLRETTKTALGQQFAIGVTSKK